MKYAWVICALSIPLCAAEGTTESAKQRAAESYGKLPMSFEANQGQTDARVRFVARGRGYSLFLTRHEAVLSLAAEKKQRAVLRVGLMHASSTADPVGVDRQEGTSNYLIGNDPSKWHTRVSNFAAVKYIGVYPGIDLVYHGNPGQLEYDFNVEPGADPRAIEMRFEGARMLRVNSAGDLVVSVGSAELIEHAPVVFQEFDGRREMVTGNYVLRGRDRVGFRLAAFDRTKALVIDPALVYSTYLGGGGDQANTIAIDTAGNAYVTGSTYSTNFPVTPGAFQTKLVGQDAFVTKLNAAGSALLYSTYLGGESAELGSGIAIDTAGNAYVTGYTLSDDFPVTSGAFQTTVSSAGQSHAFITKLNAAGSALLYSTYLGDAEGPLPGHGLTLRQSVVRPFVVGDYGAGIAIDSSGNAYIAGFIVGEPGDPNYFPVTPGAFQTTFGDTREGFVTKLNPAGSALLYSTYLGGSAADYCQGIALDAAGNAYVTGYTSSTDFPVTPGAFLTTSNGYEQGFVTKLNPAGSAQIYSTYLGGGEPSSIALDSVGDAYVTGVAFSYYPVTPGAFQISPGGGYQDGFVTKLNAAGSALLYSTYLGGNGDDEPSSIALDSAGNAYVTGYTTSTNFPVTPGAFQITSGGGASEGFVTKLNPAGSALLYSTYLGGNGYDAGYGIALDTTGKVYVAGYTSSANFPVTPGAFQTTFAGAGNAFTGDAFISKLDTTQNVPNITLAGIVPGPPTQVLISSIDRQSGLATVQVLKCTNCTAVTDSFVPGTKNPVVTTATKTDQTKSSAVAVKATGLNGNSTVFDPVDITIEGNGSAEVHGVVISPLEHLVEITNGTPGVHTLILRVNGQQFPVLLLKSGEKRTIDIASALKSGRYEEIVILSWGARGASASVVFTQP